jgi:hypothetical protein
MEMLRMEVVTERENYERLAVGYVSGLRLYFRTYTFKLQMSLYLCDVTKTAGWNTSLILYCRTGETFWGRVSKFSKNF